jgi:hypothetical protein
MMVSVKNVKKNWALYRCNPFIMPFASVFGQDAKTNFTYCIQNIQTNFMSTLLEPLNYNLGVIKDVLGSTSSSISNTRSFLNNFRTNITGSLQAVYSIFLGIVIEIQRMTIVIKDTMSKLVGILATLLYTLKGTVNTVESLWNGPPGNMVQALCFHPDTLLRLKNGEIYKMKNVPLLSELENGSIVKAVLHISNCDNNGAINETLFNVGSGVNNQDILVTKSHLIFDKASKSFVKVKDYLEGQVKTTETNEESLNLGETTIKTETLSCLITSDHIIQIGTHIFHDWEDNNGSPSKTI